MSGNCMLPSIVITFTSKYLVVIRLIATSYARRQVSSTRSSGRVSIGVSATRASNMTSRRLTNKSLHQNDTFRKHVVIKSDGNAFTEFSQSVLSAFLDELDAQKDSNSVDQTFASTLHSILKIFSENLKPLEFMTVDAEDVLLQVLAILESMCHVSLQGVRGLQIQAFTFCSERARGISVL